MKTLQDSIEYLLRAELLSLDIVATPEIIDPDFKDAEIKDAITDWQNIFSSERPCCVYCAQNFRSDALPAMFAILRTTNAFPRDDDMTFTSGICQSCAGMPRDELRAAAIRSYGDTTHIDWHQPRMMQ